MKIEDGRILDEHYRQCVINKYVREFEESKDKERSGDKDESTDVKINNFILQPKEGRLVTEQFYLTINYQRDKKEHEAYFFVKIISKVIPVMYQIAQEISASEKERFFYDVYTPYLREEGLAVDYVCKSYLCEPDIVVLEDLRKSGYKTIEETLTLDYDHCKAIYKIMAQFHADSILFEIKKSEGLDWEYKLKEAFPEPFEDLEVDESLLIIKHYQKSIQGIRDLIQFLPDHEIPGEDFATALFEVIHRIPKKLAYINKHYRSALTHSGLYADKVMFKYDVNDRITEVKMLDFQTICIKPPMFDVLALLFLNTRQSFRDKYLVELLDYYYDCFSEYVSEKGYVADDILSKSDFWETYKLLRLICKLQAMIDRSYLLIPDSVYFNHLNTEETFMYFMFEGRSRVMTKVFQGNANYKEVMTEDLIECRSFVFDDNR